jgi:copper(I)-binding protein
MKRLLAALTLALAPAAAAAHEFRVGDLSIGHPYAIETPPTARSGAGYLTIANGGSEPDRLLEIRAEVSEVQVHETERDAKGVARMRPVESLEIPPGETVTLEPQGLHVMFTGLAAPLEAGERLPATLVFERSGEVEVEFAVEPRAAGAPAHEGHGG